MTEPARRLRTYYTPCLKCQKPCCNKSGYCEDCRTGQCKKCGEAFVARAPGERYCFECRRKARHESQRI
jgi:hypothetical protein